MAKQGHRAISLAGLDIGSTKVTFTIGVLNETTRQLEVVGLGTSPHMGVKQGVVINIEATAEAIQKAREEAELMAGTECRQVWLGVGGTHIQSFDSNGMVAIKHKEVEAEDIARVIEAAKAVAIPNDREVLHVLPKNFKIDGQEGILDPIGMSGVRLEASVHIVTASLTAIQNLEKCIEKAGLEIQGKVLHQYASALAVLSADEKNLGVCVVDMGGGTCDMITFLHGSVVHTAVIPVGGLNFTHDVAMGLKTTQINAESLKRKYGHALPEMIDGDELIEVESVGGRKPRTLARRDLCDVLEARAEETLALVRQELEDKQMIGRLGSGIVLTGGASLLEGLAEMGDYIFDVPVRRGYPERVGGLSDVVKSAACASPVGILQFARLHMVEKRVDVSAEDFGLSQWTRKLKDLFS
jgi:cell division protein FtsA